ncbi:MAG: tRNA (cytidine(34)-2'-O)-methyltransferase [Arenicellales bacterium]|nr:tRNA (cytidine(34)-2'-O)-methyltransferase [Arenicellales bacterium]
MFHVILFEPEIPPNTGNIIRLCANTDCTLHLVEPLGFEPDHKQLRRAGLDYHDWAKVKRYVDYQAFLHAENNIGRLFTLSTHNKTLYTTPRYKAGDAFLFGPETRGLSDKLRKSVPTLRQITLPMAPGNRSLNLANTVSVVIYEAWRQNGFSYS